MPTVQVDQKEMESIVDFIGDAMPIIKQAEDQDAAIQAALPDTVDVMIKAGYLASSHRDAALNSMSNPVKMLEALRKVAESKISVKSDAAQTEAPATMGKSASSPSTPATGAGEGKADDLFLARFGLQR